MAKTPDILTKIDRRSGMTVPEGYFDDFVKRMEAQLPEHPVKAVEQPAAKGGLWYTLRPYVYMAAMFAGIWCMLHIFNFLGSNDVDLSIESHPGVAAALQDQKFVEEYILPDYEDEDLIRHLFESGVTIDELRNSPMTYEGDSILDEIDYYDLAYSGYDPLYDDDDSADQDVAQTQTAR